MALYASRFLFAARVWSRLYPLPFGADQTPELHVSIMVHPPHLQLQQGPLITFRVSPTVLPPKEGEVDVSRSEWFNATAGSGEGYYTRMEEWEACANGDTKVTFAAREAYKLSYVGGWARTRVLDGTPTPRAWLEDQAHILRAMFYSTHCL